MPKLWFVRTELGWIEVFYQIDPPKYNKERRRFAGRFISPISPRDAKVLKMNLKVNDPFGFRVDWTNKDKQKFYFKLISATRIKFVRRRLILWDVVVNVYCDRLIQLLDIGYLPIGTEINLYPIQD